MKFNNTYYPGSYIISPLEISESLSDYSVINIREYNFYLSEDILVDYTENEDGYILLIGYCFDIRDGLLSQKNILENLLSQNDIVSELDYINGRYIIFRHKDEKLELYSDASQLQPLVYHKKSRSLASHDKLLANLLRDNEAEIKQREDLSHHTELDYTRFYEVFKLNPSLMLDMNNFTFTRIYPRTDLTEETPEKIHKEITPYLDESINWLKNNKNEKFLTITGGIDSRVSASLSKGVSGIEYLTYLTPQKKLATKMAKNIYKIDEDITRQMKSNLGWKHEIINIFNFQVPKEQYREYNALFNSKHSFGLRNYYENHKNYRHALHVKSTVFGMGKADFKMNLDNPEENFDFYTSCLHGLPDTLISSDSFDEEIKEYYERNLVDEGVTRGRHYFDMFHLESRMGNWHSTLTLETDPQTDEFIFTNTRLLIDYIQQPSISERRDYTLYKKIINNYWPALLHFGINNNLNYYEQETKNNFSCANLNIKGSSNLVFDVKADQLSAKPKKTPISFDDLFTIKLNSSENKKYLLKSTYSNPKGQGNIRVIIRTNKEHNVYDITKLNDGVEIDVSPEGILIIMMYNRQFINSSWKDAGELLLESL